MSDLSHKKKCPSGLLLVGHGTRDPRGKADFLALSQRVARLSHDWLIEPCFLEWAEPSIPHAVNRLVKQGIRQIVAMPALLLSAAHVKQDIPHAVEKACQDYPGLEIRFTPHFGCHRHVLQLSAEHFRKAIKHCSFADEQIDLLMIGRGSSNRRTLAEFEQFVTQRAQITPAGRVEISYLAIASPSVDQSFMSLAANGSAAIVVQPHLLFQGRLFEQLTEKVDLLKKAAPSVELILAQPLGPSELLARAIVEISSLSGDQNRP